MRSTARNIIVGGVGATLATTGGALAGRSLERRWRASDDPIGPEGLTLPPRERTVVKTDDGAKLAVTICEPTTSTSAARPTVVMAHGWTSSHLVWAPVARRLVATGHRVVLYDQRGHGQSTFGDGDQSVAEPARLTVPRFGADLATVLEQLELHDVILAGHSMGGFSVLSFACHEAKLLRQRVRSLALVSTAAHGLGAGSLTPRFTRLFASKVPTWITSRPRAGVILLRRIVGRPACYSHIAAARDTFVATPPHVTAACYACFAEMDLRSPLTAVDLPSIVMVGTLDRLTPAGLSRALAASLPRAHLDVLDDAGHMLPLEAPDQVATAIANLAA